MKNKKMTGLLLIITTLFVGEGVTMNEGFTMSNIQRAGFPPIGRIDTTNGSGYEIKDLVVDDNKIAGYSSLGKEESPNSIMECGKSKGDFNKPESLLIADSGKQTTDKSPLAKRDRAADSPSKRQHGFGLHEKLTLTSRGKSRSATKHHKEVYGIQERRGPDPYCGKFDKRSEYVKEAALEKEIFEDPVSLTSSSNSNLDAC